MKYISRCKWINIEKIDISLNKVGEKGVKNLHKNRWKTLKFLFMSTITNNLEQNTFN